ncbi:MAG: hypothetical protein GXZ08_08955 [Tissierellia bacterium]|nr:hypothetical protein [Tissierellia bacterium]
MNKDKKFGIKVEKISVVIIVLFLVLFISSIVKYYEVITIPGGGFLQKTHRGKEYLDWYLEYDSSHILEYDTSGWIYFANMFFALLFLLNSAYLAFGDGYGNKKFNLIALFLGVGLYALQRYIRYNLILHNRFYMDMIPILILAIVLSIIIYGRKQSRVNE